MPPNPKKNTEATHKKFGTKEIRSFVMTFIHSLKLAYPPKKIVVSNRNLLFQRAIFRSYVRFRKGICSSFCTRQMGKIQLSQDDQDDQHSMFFPGRISKKTTGSKNKNKGLQFSLHTRKKSSLQGRILRVTCSPFFLADMDDGGGWHFRLRGPRSYMWRFHRTMWRCCLKGDFLLAKKSPNQDLPYGIYLPHLTQFWRWCFLFQRWNMGSFSGRKLRSKPWQGFLKFLMW